MGRKAWALKKEILRLQAAVTAPELCPQPVIAAVHNGCIGGGIDIISACDIRLCSTDAYFTVKVCSDVFCACVTAMCELVLCKH